MFLQSARLLLRAMRPSDDKDLFRIYGDPATNTFNPAGPYPSLAFAQQKLAERLAAFKRYGFESWAISTRDAPDTLIGFGGLSVRKFAGELTNNLGYRFDTQAWGKGYATELSRFALDYGFNKLGLASVTASVRRHHQASIHVLEKSGLRYIKEIYDVENAPPSLCYAITREQWQAAQTTAEPKC
ncbi:GNAT family N-acetyltransferase [Pantoea sp. PNA 03-3]|uniref:GNAT family N-acetyltransferase n=1 Tax=Pantoea sp. PNA 03-3 TaxID=2135460 RepID=UPI000D76D69D|nr:GNAT family N-acetyltransferase [Pantoea sp. PNA 03-3]PXV78167.1 RimJ/RimL family protein N-acetyltransferase [Pantoea sp. PNA 03-3]